MSAAIEIAGVSKVYDGGVRAVDAVAMDIRPGEFFSLLGPSGCGKTTTLRMIAGFDSPSTGKICLDGADITHVPAHKRDMAMVFQNYALFPHRTVAENVAFGLRMRKVDKATIAAKVKAALAMVELSGMEDRRPAQLSGGQQQRVALARALITSPQILLLDEPLSALDPFLRLRMRAELKRLQRELGLTFIHVTHGQDEAMALSDLVVLMNGGRIEQQGSPREIFNHPRTEFAARFIGGHNVIPLNGETFAVRVDRIQLKAPTAAIDGPAVPGTISKIEYQGTYVLIAVTTDGGPEISAQLSDDQFDAETHVIGERVVVTWNPALADALTPHSATSAAPAAELVA